MTCPTTGRHPDDRVAGRTENGWLIWKCAHCKHLDWRRPVRDYPPEIDCSERQPTATRREDQGEGSGMGPSGIEQPAPTTVVIETTGSMYSPRAGAWEVISRGRYEMPYTTYAKAMRSKTGVRDHAAIEREWTGEPNPKSFTMPCGLHDRPRCEECRP